MGVPEPSASKGMIPAMSQGLFNSDLPHVCQKSTVPNKECGIGFRTFSLYSIYFCTGCSQTFFNYDRSFNISSVANCCANTDPY